jgi:hypothetical protein
MIDGWFVLLVLSFISSVGGLVHLLGTALTESDGDKSQVLRKFTEIRPSSDRVLFPQGR